MRFDVTVPCKSCPFRRRGKHVVRLGRFRVREVAGNMLNINGKTFSCHNACHGERDDDGVGYHPAVTDIHCAGALIFAERNGVRSTPLQLAERFGLYEPDRFCTTQQRRLVFATLAEMLAVALPGR
jgi:hypothetical protein